MPQLDLAAWLCRLEQLHPTEIELGLERVSLVAARLDCLEFDCPVVTVAGTNGKGTTVAVLEAIAVTAGVSVGSHTSPHLFAFNERVRLDGKPVSDALLIDAFSEIDSARGDTSLTYFEFATLAGLLIFKRAKPDLVILEVGLGGRLDAVNIVDPRVAVITSISLDHQGWLGDTRELIALEKAGILRPGVAAVIADEQPPQSLQQRLRELQCDVYWNDQGYNARFPESNLRSENIAAAWRVAALLGLSCPEPEQAGAVLAAVTLPGRLQSVHWNGSEILLDVAHNVASVENLVSHLGRRPRGRVFALFAVLSDKDIHAMIRACYGCFDGWHVTTLPNTARARPAAELADFLRANNESVCGVSDTPEQAWQLLMRELGAGDTLVVFGSFFTVAAVLPLIEAQRSPA